MVAAAESDTTDTEELATIPSLDSASFDDEWVLDVQSSSLSGDM